METVETHYLTSRRLDRVHLQAKPPPRHVHWRHRQLW